MRLLGRCLENACPSDRGAIAMIRQLETSYPRPQLQRGNWLNLNGDWKFAYDDDGQWKQPSHVSEWNQTIVVPFAPESKRSGIHDTGFHSNCWYERSFDLEPGQDSNRVLLHFGAVDYRARVWVNHQFVGEHEGGHTSDLQHRYASLLGAVNRVEIFSGFCYTQLTDTFQEANGLLYIDRTPKFPLDAIAAATLGRDERLDDSAILTAPVPGTWSEAENVLPGTAQAGWTEAHPIQSVLHCSRHSGSQPW